MVDGLEEGDTGGGQPCPARRLGQWRLLKSSVQMSSCCVSTLNALAYLKRLLLEEDTHPAQGNEGKVW